MSHAAGTGDGTIVTISGGLPTSSPAVLARVAQPARVRTPTG
jgi:hypothetical protein